MNTSCYLVFTQVLASFESTEQEVQQLIKKRQVVEADKQKITEVRSVFWKEARLSLTAQALFLSSVADTRGRTVQVLPREAQVTGQIGAQRITIYKESNVIISLPYIGQAKQGIKHIKESPRLGGTHTGQHKMIMVVQTVQQLHQTMHQFYMRKNTCLTMLSKRNMNKSQGYFYCWKHRGSVSLHCFFPDRTTVQVLEMAGSDLHYRCQGNEVSTKQSGQVSVRLSYIQIPSLLLIYSDLTAYNRNSTNTSEMEGKVHMYSL